MMGARLDFRASFRIVSTVALGVMILFHGAFTVFGHHCGEPQITVEVGRTVAYRITADLSESQASHYNLSINSDPAIAVASPDNFDAFNYGEFTIRGVSPGTNRFVFEWSYAPNQASGFCVVEVIVVPRGSTTQTAANQPQSGQAGDPVNTLTGEFLLQEMPDLQLYGPMPLYFSRYYASGLQMDGQAHGNLGPNWLHNFEYRLLRSGDTAEVLTQQGRKILFQNSTGSWSLQNGGGAPFQLVSEGDLYVFGDPISQRVFVFNTGGQLIRIEDGKGNAHTLTYTGNVLTAVSDGLGRELTFTYVSLQQLFQVTSGIRSVRFSYGANMELLTVRDPVNNPVNYQYQNTAMGPLLLSKSLPMGNSHLTNRYDPMGRIESQRDAYGNLFAYRFDPGLTTVTNPLGGTEQHVHNSQNQLVTVTDEAGRSIHLGYDTNGNRTSIQDREGGVTLISYHASGKPAAITNADHTVVRYAYSPRTYRGITFHDLARTDYPDGTFESYGRDAAGNILFLTNRQGSVRTFTYNNRGQVLTARNPTGGVTDYAYNTNGTLASISREGNSVTLAYDALGRLVQEQHPDGTRRLYARDLLDRVVRMTNELGGILEYQYDANGNQISRNHPGEALEHEHGFDKMDRLSSFMAPGGVMSLLQFDALGRTAAIIHDGGRTNRFSYDAVGNVTEIEDAEGSIWRFAYDTEGVVTQKVNPLNKTNRFVTDAMGRVTTHTSAKGNSRQIEYDSMGQLRAITAPDGLKTTLEYENSLLKSLTVGTNGLQNIFAYNPLGRETEQKDPAGSFWRQEFDSHGRRTAAIDPLGRRTEYQYDTRGRASRVTFPGSLGSVQIEYDGLNAITRRLYSDGNDLRYEYDRKGQLTNATGVTLERDHSGLITRCNGIEISRTSQKQINTITYAAGKIVTYAYNKRNQVVTMDDWLGGRYFFEYDAAGRLIRITRPGQSASPTRSESTFGYDDEDRLLTVAHTNQVAIYPERDASGRIAQTSRDFSMTLTNPADFTSTYDVAHQAQAGTYDALGRVTNDGRRSYRWDAASRLVEHTEAGTTTLNTYDAFGNRLSRRRGSETKNYVWNYGMGMPSVLIIRDGAGADQWYYLYTPGGQLVAGINAATNQRYYYFFDENGNTLSVVDDSGTVVARYLYGPYGEPLAASSQIENPFTFQGKYGVMHEGGGLYYMRARWYDSATCRFLSRDPLKSRLPKAANPYQYALNSPARYNDPLGLQSVDSQDPPQLGDAPASARDAARQKGVASTDGESGSVTESSTPPSSGVVYLTHEEWNTEVRRVKRLLHDRVKKAEWGWLDPEVPATFDSAYLKRQRESFSFRGLVMNGGELNYYFQGMYWKELGVPKDVMVGIIYAYKQIKYGRNPSVNDLFAACHGYEDNPNFFTELRDEALHYGEIISSLPESMGEVVIEGGSAIVDFFSPLIPSFGE